MPEFAAPTRLEAGEERAFALAVLRHFHEDGTEEGLDRWAAALADDPDYRAWIIRDRDEIVGNLGVFRTDLSLPGGARIENAAVTAVGVAQTHRRRGALRALMRTCLEEAAQLGEPVASLYASEAGIYGRYGFGPASPTLRFLIDRNGAALRDPVDVRIVEPVAYRGAVTAFRPVFERLRDVRSSVGRTPMGWSLAFDDDPPGERDGASALRMVQVPGRGFATYRVKDAWDGNLPVGVVHVRDLVATDAEAEAALWQHVCDIDLTATIDVPLRPPDDALLAMLVQPTRARPGVAEPVYTRILDVVRVLEARAYANAGRLSMRVHDQLRGGTRTYRLEVSPEGAACTPTDDAEADLELDVEALSTIWLGGVRATQLLGARRITAVSDRVAAEADRLLAVDRAPWTPFNF